MCRLFGMLSVKAASPLKWLAEDEFSLLVQSDYNPKRLQGDGWGVGTFNGKRALLVQSVRPVFSEKEIFRAAASGAEGNAVLAHIRLASNPNRLPKSELLLHENIQPFFGDGWLFIHNGQVNDKNGAAEGLGPFAARIEGTNDSEVLFWHFIKALCETEKVPDALRLMEERIAPCHKKGKEAYTALNVIVTNGMEMHALCKFTAQPKKFPKSICLGKQGTYNMCYKMEKGKAIVMSEMSNSEKGWKIMENGDILSLKLMGGKVRAQLHQ